MRDHAEDLLNPHDRWRRNVRGTPNRADHGHVPAMAWTECNYFCVDPAARRPLRALARM